MAAFYQVTDEWTGTCANTTWYQWTQTTSACTNITSYWPIWVNQTGLGNVNVTVQPGVNYGSSAAAPRDERTEEQRRAAREEAERRSREYREQQAQKQQRARELLLSVLDEVQKEELEKAGRFHVQTRNGERTYRLRPGESPTRVKGEDGQFYAYCIHPLLGFPPDDTAAALKLLLEHDEDEFLRIANATRIANPA